jgi:hypothetical protein
LASLYPLFSCQLDTANTLPISCHIQHIVLPGVHVCLDLPPRARLGSWFDTQLPASHQEKLSVYFWPCGVLGFNVQLVPSLVELDFTRPGNSTNNGFIEAFNGKFQAKCLNSHWFMSLEDAAEKLEAWRRNYNEEKPRSAIGNKVPAELMKSAHDASPCT